MRFILDSSIVMSGLALGILWAQPVSAQAVGDPVIGKKQFGQCRVCHTVVPKGPDGVGPNLYGIVGSKAATRQPKFKYSPALKASKVTWTETNLDKWITDPSAMVKGTSMHFVGIPRKPVRQNIVAYLKNAS